MQPAAAEDHGEQQPAAAEETGDEPPPECRIGLLLDLDAGSLSVYKNDVRLGAMVDGQRSQSGAMKGAYCWALSTKQLGTRAHEARSRGHTTRSAQLADKTFAGRYRCGADFTDVVLTLPYGSAHHQEIASRSRQKGERTSRAATADDAQALSISTPARYPGVHVERRGGCGRRKVCLLG